MTINEFHTKVIELGKELYESNNGQYEIFVSVHDRINENTFTFGSGCPACFVEDLISIYETDAFQHNSPPSQQLDSSKKH